MSPGPAVSVVMPAYDAARWIRPAVESVLAQTFRDLELVVVDDGSRDETASILAGYADARLRVVRNERNLGHTGALARGMELARGRLLARMDADDVCHPERLRRQVDFLAAHPAVGVLGTWVRVIDGAGAVTGGVEFPTSPGLVRWWLCFLDPVVHPSGVMRGEVYRAAGGYRTEMRHAEDYDLWCRASRIAQVANLGEALLDLRKHGDNVSTRQVDAQADHSRRVQEGYVGEILADAGLPGILPTSWGSPRSAAEALEEVRLLGTLERVLRAAPGATAEDARAIRRDAGRRAYLALRPWAGHPATWPAMVSALRRYPYPVRERLAQPGRRPPA